MTNHQNEARRRAAKRARVISTAEWVLARAYRACTRDEMIESQIRVRESVVREMRRRVKR